MLQQVDCGRHVKRGIREREMLRIGAYESRGDAKFAQTLRPDHEPPERDIDAGDGRATVTVRRPTSRPWNNQDPADGCLAGRTHRS